MRIEQVEKIRQRSKGANGGPWITDYPEMVKKTCLRQHSKALPKAKDDLERARITAAIRGFDDAEQVIDVSHQSADVPKLTMHQEAAARIASAVDEIVFDEGDESPTEAPQAAPPKAKRRSSAERIAATEAELAAAKAAKNGNGAEVAAAPADEAEFEEVSENPAPDDDTFPGDLPAKATTTEEAHERSAYEQGWRMYFEGRLREAPGVWAPRAMGFWYRGWDSARKQNADKPEAVQNEKQQEALLTRVVNQFFV